MAPAIDLAFRPLAYWDAADPPAGGTALATIVYDSWPSSAATVVATPRPGGRIAFGVVDDAGGRYAVRPAEAERPLSLGELVALIDGAQDLEAPEAPPGLVLGVLASARGAGEGFVTVHSWTYPQLEAHYVAAVRAALDGRRPRTD